MIEKRCSTPNPEPNAPVPNSENVLFNAFVTGSISTLAMDEKPSADGT